MVLDPIPQSLPVHFFGSRPQPPTSHPSRGRIHLVLHSLHSQTHTKHKHIHTHLPSQCRMTINPALEQPTSRVDRQAGFQVVLTHGTLFPMQVCVRESACACISGVLWSIYVILRTGGLLMYRYICWSVCMCVCVCRILIHSNFTCPILFTDPCSTPKEEIHSNYSSTRSTNTHIRLPI